MEHVRKHRDIKLATTERRRNYLVSEPNYHTTKFFTETLRLFLDLKTFLSSFFTVNHGFFIFIESGESVYDPSRL